MPRIHKLLSLLFAICFSLTALFPVSGVEESSPPSSSSDSIPSLSSSVSAEETSSVTTPSLSTAPTSSSDSPSSSGSTVTQPPHNSSSSSYSTRRSTSTTPLFAPTDPVTPFDWTDKMESALNNGCTYLKLNEKSSEYLLATGISGISSDITTATRTLDEIEQKQGQYDSPLELSQDIITLTFSSFNPENFRDINLIETLAHTPLLEGQDIDEQSIALIAFDSGSFSVPEDAQNSRNALISRILACQQEDGGFSNFPNDSASTTQATAVAITALSPYQQEPEITASLQKALSYLQKASFPKDCSSLAWLITALSSLSLLPTDTRFTHGNTDLVTELLLYQHPDGGFSQVKGDDSTDSTITEQAVIALTAAKLQTDPFLLRNSITYDSQENTHSFFSSFGIAIGALLLFGAAVGITWFCIRKKK